MDLPREKGKILKALEEEIQYSSDTNETPPQDVFAYNELRSCADLYRMYKDEVLNIQPDYQREIVWKSSDQTRFIDSLMKELPIPSMCFSLDSETQRWQVIDGLQRMATIIKFLGKDDWVLSKLEDIDPRISNKSVVDIRKESPDLYRRVENLTLPVTILRCDFSRKDHLEYIFTIFHRLNTGGLRLSNQEIRNAIFQGNFNDLLLKCDRNSQWLLITGRRDPNKLDRFQNMELILRFFAFLESYKDYNGRLTSFLNEFMRTNRGLDNKKYMSADQKEDIFQRTINVASKILKKRSEKLSNVLLDALLFGVARNIDRLEKIKIKELEKTFDNFIENPVFSKENISEGTLKKRKVLERLSTTEKLFSGE